MKVYGWQSFRSECPPAPNGSRQTREIMAARSVAAVMRATGISRAEWENVGCETGNDIEVAVASAKPGTIFWAPLRASSIPAEEFRESAQS